VGRAGCSGQQPFGIRPANVKGIVFRDAETVVTTPPREPEQNLDLLPMPAFDLYRDVLVGKRRFANVLCNR